MIFPVPRRARGVAARVAAAHSLHPPVAMAVTTLPPALAALCAALGELPGIGPRSAERIALFLAQAPPETGRRLAQAIVAARERVQVCRNCGALTETQPCGICADARRDPTCLCVVERPVDVLFLERAGSFRGRYHVLGGKLSPLSGVEPEDLRLAELEARLAREPVREVILALASDVEGDATCHYLAQRLGGRAVTLTRLAHGLPAGTALDLADEVTLHRALAGRQPLTP